MSFPEDSSTLVRIAQLMRSSCGVVLAEVSTPFLYAVGSLRRKRSIVDGNLSTMPAKFMLENVEGICYGEEWLSMRFVVWVNRVVS